MQVSARDFTDVQGRRITGELASASPAQGIVTVKRADGTLVTFPYKQLAASDQTYVSEWWKKNRPYSFKVGHKLDRGSRTKVGEIEKQTSGGTATAKVTEAWAAYVIDLQSLSNEPTPPLVLQCFQFSKEDLGAKMAQPMPNSYCEEVMPALKAGSQHKFICGDIILGGASAGRGSMFNSGNTRVMKDQPAGFFLRIWDGDRPVYTYATSKELETFGAECILRYYARELPGTTDEVLNIMKPLDLRALACPPELEKGVPLLARLNGTRWKYGSQGTLEFKDGNISTSWGKSGNAFVYGIKWVQWEDEDIELEFNIGLTRFTARTVDEPDVLGVKD